MLNNSYYLLPSSFFLLSFYLLDMSRTFWAFWAQSSCSKMMSHHYTDFYFPGID